MPTLTVDLEGARSRFAFDSVAVIGRDATADLVVRETSVSRRHAVISLDGTTWTVRDLGSANGTFVNDRRITQSSLADGDTIRLGSVVVRFNSGAEHAAAEASRTMVGSGEMARPEIVLRMDARTGLAATADSAAAAQLSLIAESFNRISTSLFDERALLDLAVEELLKLLPRADRALVMLWDGELQRLVYGAGRSRTGGSEHLAPSYTLLQDALSRREATLVADVSSDDKYARAVSVVRLKIRAAVCTPIIFQSDVFGVIQVDSLEAGLSLGRREVALTIALAAQVAMALAYARAHAKLLDRELSERDLALARKIQHHFLPAGPPPIRGYSFGIEYAPAQAVGGDLYDFVPLDGGRIAIVVGDVSGKGIAAALFAAKVMSDMRNAAQAGSASALLGRVNERLAERDNEGMFVTVSVAVLDPSRSRLSVASAGHPLPLVRGSSGEVSAVGVAGDPPLGVNPHATFAQHEYAIEPGDTVVMYTDGVTEAMNRAGDLYGVERLSERMTEATTDAVAQAHAIAKDVRAFARGVKPSDDLTLVCFGRSPGAQG